jgi:uncharacterized membrane protein YdjX (TVP38/TMEM64 family)
MPPTLPVPAGAGRWLRLALLVALLAAAGAAVLVCQPQRLLPHGAGTFRVAGGGTAVLLFGAAYGLCAVAFVPRPLLNTAAGALLGVPDGLLAAVAGTVLGGGLAFVLGRYLGRDALRPLVRGRVLVAADRQLSEHGFRSMLTVRLLPGIPFAAANYAAAVSRMRVLPFLLATGLGCVPNTAAYVAAGAHATRPGSPLFLGAVAVAVLPGLCTALAALRRRRLARRRTEPGGAAAQPWAPGQSA